MSVQVMKVIDVTPTWGEWGAIYRRFAESGERRAVAVLAKDHAHAMAAAQAYREMQEGGALSETLQRMADAIIAREMRKQGYTS